MPVGKIIKAAKYLMKKGEGKTGRYLPASETDWLKSDTIRVTKKKPESPMSDADLIQAIRESPDAYIEFAGESRAARAEALRKLSDAKRKLSDAKRNPAQAEALRKIDMPPSSSPLRAGWESRKLSARQLNTALFGESTLADIAFMNKVMRTARHAPQAAVASKATRRKAKAQATTKGKGYKAK
jgi:hypothetical protein